MSSIVVPAGVDVGVFFSNLATDITNVEFSSSTKYHSNGDIILPLRRLLIIDGKGSSLTLGPNSNGFSNVVNNMTEAMQLTSCRYIVKDFSTITGGKRAINFSGSLGNIIENCDLVSQTEAAIDLRFCLLSKISCVRVIHPRKNGIVLRQGDWYGANGINSQCNNSILEQCHVYCNNATLASFTILNSNGVKLINCSSEGESADYDLFLSATMDGDETKTAGNPVVKSFDISGFHVEHRVRKASIYVNMPSKSSINLDNIYWNGYQPMPVLLYTLGQVNLSHIGWWDRYNFIGTRINAPRINVTQSHDELNLAVDKKVLNNKSKSFALFNPLEGNNLLQTNYIRISNSSV